MAMKGKTVAKKVAKAPASIDKKKRKRLETYSIYIYKVLKQFFSPPCLRGRSSKM